MTQNVPQNPFFLSQLGCCDSLHSGSLAVVNLGWLLFINSDKYEFLKDSDVSFLKAKACYLGSFTESDRLSWRGRTGARCLSFPAFFFLPLHNVLASRGNLWLVPLRCIGSSAVFHRTWPLTTDGEIALKMMFFTPKFPLKTKFLLPS